MKNQLDPRSARLWEYVQHEGSLVRVPEKSETDCTNRMILLQLAYLYVSPLPPQKVVGRLWKERRLLRTALIKDLAKVRWNLHKLQQVQAKLAVCYEKTGTGLLVEDYEVAFPDRFGFICEFDGSIKKFVDSFSGSGTTRLHNPTFDGQYAIYLMVAYYRRITGQQRRVFMREIASLINEVGYYFDARAKVMDQDCVRDAYRRFRCDKQILAGRIDSDPMKYIRTLLRLSIVSRSLRESPPGGML